MSSFERSRIPSYRRHKPTGQAVVTLDGRDIYLGRWNTKASRQEYDRLIGEWVANGRQLPVRHSGSLTISELTAAYLRHAKTYLRQERPAHRRAGRNQGGPSLSCGALRPHEDLRLWAFMPEGIAVVHGRSGAVARLSESKRTQDSKMLSVGRIGTVGSGGRLPGTDNRRRPQTGQDQGGRIEGCAARGRSDRRGHASAFAGDCRRYGSVPASHGMQARRTLHDPSLRR